MSQAIKPQTGDRPFAAMLKAAAKLAQQDIDNIILDEKGNMEFGVRLSDLGIDLASFSKNPLHRTPTFASFFGELFVRAHLDQLFDALMGKDYSGMVNAYTHNHFGMKTNSQKSLLIFQFHVSFLHKIFNAKINSELPANSPAAVSVPSRKTELDMYQPKILAVSDNNLRIQIPSSLHAAPREMIEATIQKILAYCGIKNKDIFVSKNAFSCEIDVTAK